MIINWKAFNVESTLKAGFSMLAGGRDEMGTGMRVARVEKQRMRCRLLTCQILEEDKVFPYLFERFQSSLSLRATAKIPACCLAWP